MRYRESMTILQILQHSIIVNSFLNPAKCLLFSLTMKTLSETMRQRLMSAESTISEMN